MLLTIDIGNSSLKLGAFSGSDIVFSASTSTDTSLTRDDSACRILSLLSLYSLKKEDIDGAIISSVVPQLTSRISDAVELISGKKPLVVGPGIKTGISIQCDTPSSVGADLICASVAVSSLYGAPALVVDVGTATKMTVINKKGAFVGTSIIPGVIMGLNALSNETAQLPKVSLAAPETVIAKNTADCMRSGVIYGNASMIDGMIDRIASEVGEELSVYVTGGSASLIIPHCTHKMTYDENLILKGLEIIYRKNT